MVARQDHTYERVHLVAFKDLSEYLQPGITLPIRGKNYVIPAPSAEDGLRITMMMADPGAAYTDYGELTEIMKLLGAEWVPNEVTVDLCDPETGLPLLDDKGEIRTVVKDRGTWRGGVLQEMMDDGLSWQEIAHAGRTALIDVGQGRVIAEAIWAAGADPGNPLPPNPAETPVEEGAIETQVEGNRAERRKAAKGKKKA